MNADKEFSRSVWLDAPPIRAPRLRADLRTGVLVIGGGISGLSTAYELAAAGHDVVIIDRGVMGGGMTARTTAHLSWEIDDTYAQLIKTLGERESRNYFDSQKAAVDRIEEICTRESIACDFARLDLFVFASNPKGRKTLAGELKALAKLGVHGVDWADAPVAGNTHGALRFPDQARFQPMRYLAGLARAVVRRGGKLFGNTTIASVEETRSGVVAKTDGGQTIRARAAIAATNAPFVGRMAVHKKQTAYRTYAISLEVPKDMPFDALVWDTDEPYHYARAYRTAKASLLIVGGEDHRTGGSDDADVRLKRLEAWARKRFPGVGLRRHAWSGQVFEPVDYAPFVGHSPSHKNVFIVTGDSGEGLTTGVAASLILPDLIAGRKNAWSHVYNPSRKTPPSRIAKRAKDPAGHFPRKVQPNKLKRDAGTITGDEENRIAAYRDARGKLHYRSAACTHVGCTVQWNSFERCWDCPCHGSHFAALGEAIQCPAVTPLPARRG